MEHGVRFHRYRRNAKQPTSSSAITSTTGMSLTQANIAPNINLPVTLSPNNNPNRHHKPTAAPPQALPRLQPEEAQCLVREQDQYMPIANVIRIMRRILPAHAKISDDAKETIQECVSEYISFITGEANDRCQREQRKTITAEDVLWAMGKLGFDDYVEPLTLFLNRYREMDSDRSSIIRDPILKRNNVGVVDYGNFGYNMPAAAAAFPMVPPPPPPPPPQGVMFDPASLLLGGYYRDVSDASAGGSGGAASTSFGGSSSQNPLAHFDPFAQFK